MLASPNFLATSVPVWALTASHTTLTPQEEPSLPDLGIAPQVDDDARHFAGSSRRKIRDGSKRYDTGINWFCAGSQKKLEDGFSIFQFFLRARAKPVDACVVPFAAIPDLSPAAAGRLSFFPLSRSLADNSRNMLKPVGQSVAQPQKISLFCGWATDCPTGFSIFLELSARLRERGKNDKLKPSPRRERPAAAGERSGMAANGTTQASTGFARARRKWLGDRLPNRFQHIPGIVRKAAGEGKKR
jgi:hypothetical protein